MHEVSGEHPTDALRAQRNGDIYKAMAQVDLARVDALEVTAGYKKVQSRMDIEVQRINDLCAPKTGKEDAAGPGRGRA